MLRRFASLTMVLVLVSLAVLVTPDRGAAQDPAWYVGGAGLVDDDGRLYISEQVPINLIEMGLTYVRVTSGPCNGSAQDWVVYEAALTPEGASNQVLVALLEPIGRLAPPVIEPEGAYNVFLFGRGAYSGFTVAMSGLPPDVTFTACFAGAP